MKRSDPYFTAKKIWPWFLWKVCCNCRREFRREPGWMVQIHGRRLGIWGVLNELHYCTQCVSTQKAAISLAQQTYHSAPPRIISH